MDIFQRELRRMTLFYTFANLFNVWLMFAETVAGCSDLLLRSSFVIAHVWKALPYTLERIKVKKAGNLSVLFSK